MKDNQKEPALRKRGEGVRPLGLTDQFVGDLLITLSLFHKLVRQGWRRKKGGYASILPYHVLGVLGHLGTLSVSEIGKRLNISKPNMTPLIDRLVNDGMVVREPDAEDRRVIKISITQKGLDLMAVGRKKMKETMEKVFSEFTEEDLTRLSGSLETLKALLLKASSQEK
jgi:DNA-binding MarR family transcriptional regulator